MLAGQMIVGFSVSLTVTVCTAVPGLLAGSVAVQVMVVMPTGYGALSALPSPRVPTGVRAPAQVSTAVAVPGLIEAEHCPGSAAWMMLAGGVTTGWVVSTTLTVRVTGAAAVPEGSGGV